MTNYELRIIPECPNSGPALDLFRLVLAEEGLTGEGLAEEGLTGEGLAGEGLAEEGLTGEGLAGEGKVPGVSVRELTSEEEARELVFHGSPSFLADGVDLFPSDADPALSCRVYASVHGMAGLPSVDSLRAAVRCHQESTHR